MLIFHTKLLFVLFRSEHCEISTNILKMARGLQKLQSQQKNNEKNAKKGSATDQKNSAQAGLLWKCKVCMVGF